VTLRRVTHKGQKLSGHLQRIKNQTTTAINKRFSADGTMHGTSPKYFLNMDETAVFFESKSQTVVSPKGKKRYHQETVGVMQKGQQLLLPLQLLGPSLIPFLFLKISLMLWLRRPWQLLGSKVVVRQRDGLI
jgi:hypothetical protein